MKSLSVEEIREAVQNLKRTPLDLPFLYLPKKIVIQARNNLGSDIEKVLRYIENAFYIYRASVCTSFFAPHYVQKDVYEWPNPVKFSWTDINTVILIGESVYGIIPIKKTAIVVGKKVQTRIEEILVIPEEDKLTRKTYHRKFQQGKDDFDQRMKYKIYEFSKLGFLFSDHWQNASPEFYANPLYFLLCEVLNQTISLGKAKEYVENLLDLLEVADMRDKF